MNIVRPQTPVSTSSTRISTSRHSIHSPSLSVASLFTSKSTKNDHLEALKQAIQMFQERPLVKDITPSLMSLVEAVHGVLADGAPSPGLLFSTPVYAMILDLLCQVTLKTTMDSIKELSPNDPEKQIQAWIIIALNEGLISTYFQVLVDNEAPQIAGYSASSAILTKTQDIIQLLGDLIGKTEFQLHLEDLMEYKPTIPDVKISGSIISRTSPSLETSPKGLTVLSIPKSPTLSVSQSPIPESELDSTKESPRSCLLEPVPIAPPSPLVQAQPGMLSDLWTRATSFFTTSPSPSSYTESSFCSNVESLLNIRDGICCGSLLNQNFKCPQCRTSLATGEQKFCEFSGKFYCQECFGDITSINPFRVINNWDFTPQPLYHPLQQRVQEIIEKESFLISEVLFEAIPQLREFRDARIQLSHDFAVLLVKGQVDKAESVRAQLGEHAHLVTESADIFTINDLHALYKNRITSQSLLDISKSVQ